MHSGKIKSHGIALGPAIGWEEEGVMAMKRRSITCLQTVYNILEQDPGRTLFNNAKKYDVGIMVRVPDASGVLTGKINEKTIFDKNDHRANRKKEWINESMKKIEKMKPFLSTKGLDMSQLAVKFILSQKQVSVVLPTVTDIEEIETFAEMSDGNYLNESELAYITKLYNNNFYVESVVSS